MDITKFSDITGLSLYISADPGENTINKSGNAITSVVSASADNGSAHPFTANDGGGTNKVQHDPGTIKLGQMAAFESTVDGGDAALQCDFAQQTSAGDYTIVLAATFEGPEGKRMVEFTGHSGSTTNDISLETSGQAGRIRASNSIRDLTGTTMTQGVPFVFVVRWNNANGGTFVPEGWIDNVKSGALAAAAQHTGDTGWLTLLNRRSGIASHQGKIGLLAYYDRLLSDQEVSDIHDLARYWIDNGEAPSTGPEPSNQTTSIDYKHPYATLTWQHQPSGGQWQDAANLSGYVSGQGTKTLELSGATEAEAGYLRCAVSNPAGAIRYSDTCRLTATASAPQITEGISDKTPYEGESAVYGPITVTGSPTPTLLWEAETADGNNTWADADTVFGADGSGQGTDTYTIANTVPADNRDVRVTATNAEGSDVSQAALTVTPKLAFVSVEPTDKTVTATGGAPAEYLHDFARGNPITLGGFNGTPTDGVYTDPDHRPSDATGEDSAGVFQTVTSNVPVIVGGSLSGNIWSEAASTQGLQLEESRTNYCRWSEWPSGGGKGADWQSRGTGFIGDGYPSPDGGNNAARIALSSGSTNDIWFSRAIGIGTDIPYEIYVAIRYVDGPNFEIRHANGAAGGQWNIDVTKLPQGEWTGVNKNHEAVTVATPFNTRAGNGSIHFYNTSATTANMDIYAVQLEGDVAFPTSYIPTSGTAVIRAATNCSATFTQLGAPLPAGGFTNDFCGQLSLQLKFASTVTGDTTLFSIGDATNGIAILINGTTLMLRKYVGGTPTDLTLTTAAYATGDDVDIRYRISASDMKLWWNVATTNANANGTALAAAASTATLEPGNVIARQCRILPTAADDTAIGNWETWSPPS